MNKIKIRLIFILLLGIYIPTLQAQKDYDDHLNAIFIYNFTNFITWPLQAFETEMSLLTICLYGKVTFKKNIEVFNGIQVRERKISIVELKNKADLKNSCHILYVGDDKVESVAKIIDSLGHQYILSVADMDDFVKKGGMLHILRVNDGKKFRINLRKIMNNGLVISADLLELSEVI